MASYLPPCLPLGCGVAILQAARPSIVTATTEPSGTPVGLLPHQFGPAVFPRLKRTVQTRPARAVQTQVRATEGLSKKASVLRRRTVQVRAAASRTKDEHKESLFSPERKILHVGLEGLTAVDYGLLEPLRRRRVVVSRPAPNNLDSTGDSYFMANVAKSSLPTIMASHAAYDPFTPIDAVSASPLSISYSTWAMRCNTPSRETRDSEPEPLHGLVTRLMAACASHTTTAAIPATSPSSSSADEDDDDMQPISRGRTRRSENVGMGKDWGRQSVLSVNEISRDTSSPADTDGTLYQTLESRQSARKDLFLAAMSCHELGIIHEDAREE